MKQHHGPSHSWLLLAGTIGVAMLIASLLWIGLATHPVAAQSAFSEANTSPSVPCTASPTALHCDGFAPDLSGCTQDERTVRSVPVMHRNRLVGSAQLQYSPSCDSYWLMGLVLANTPDITSITIPTKKDAILPMTILPDGERVALGFLFYHTPSTGADAQVFFDFPTTDRPPSALVSV